MGNSDIGGCFVCVVSAIGESVFNCRIQLEFVCSKSLYEGYRTCKTPPFNSVRLPSSALHKVAGTFAVAVYCPGEMVVTLYFTKYSPT